MERRDSIDITRLDRTGSILLVRLFALGDIVLTLPLVREMRRAFPGAWIGYLCRERYAESLAGDTGLDEVLTLEPGLAGQVRMMAALRRRRLDIAIDLLGSPRSALITRLSGARMRIGMRTGRRDWYYHRLLPRTVEEDGRRVRCYTLEANLHLGRLLGLSVEPRCGGSWGGTDETTYGFPAAAAERGWALSYVAGLGQTGEGLAGIVPGSTYSSKSWPEDRFVELAGFLSREMGLRPIVIWGPGEEEIARRIAEAVPGAVMPEPMGIARVGALIERLRLLVGVDSGPKHIAVLLGVPTVTLFGPTDPELWDPMDARHAAISHRLDCMEGCRRRECAPNRCMEAITVEEVAAAAAGVLAAGAASSGAAGKEGA
jgi:heptosyltransferase II